MAALLLSAAGAAAGSALFGTTGAIAGRIAGALAGNFFDQSLFGAARDRQVQGPRLADLDVMASTEGAPIPRVYGRVRLAGQVIWATNLEEIVSTRTDTQGGKGGIGGGVTTTTTTYSYFANFAVGLCEGPIGTVLRVWADSKPFDMTTVTSRIYRGTEDQEADPLIVAKQGEGGTPNYRGLAYIVFERLPLENFGNRIPQLSFEIVRPVGALESMVRAVTLIPGTTEFGYEPATVVQLLGPGQIAPENRHVSQAASDVVASLDDLQAACPALERVAIVVTWFGDDLRADTCTLMPGVERRDKTTYGPAGDSSDGASNATWSVAGLDRATARLVSMIDDRPAFGGTPSDASVTDLIAELKARGLKVTLYPFVIMDIPADNTLPDPVSGAAGQPAYPWRGRITCDPAPGQAGSPDGSAAAADQVNAFFNGVLPNDWRYRKMILHYAQLAADAGGVDAFLIGSELKALTRIRAASGVYPAVDALKTLAADVRTIVGADTVITYGADWTEYGAHVVDADAQEVRFPLDALWASPAINAVGIDYYAPLADWRDSADHLDRAVSQTDSNVAYLTSNLAGGEAFDWYYADDAAREAQTRTPITDGLGKPWMFRSKDIWNWWANPHYERVGGVELASSTAWVAQNKPIWLTETGCPAVDKGANQPSIFPDPKSSEAGLPYFSSGRRDDLIQRRFCEAMLTALDPAHGATTLNPVSTVTGARMLDVSAIHLWTWDARPYPVFPAALDVWSDGGNWDTGHWLTGRLGGAPLDGLLGTILADARIADVETATLSDTATGYVIDRPMTPRAAIEPLASYFAFDAAQVGDVLRFAPRGGVPVASLGEDDLVLPDQGAPYRFTRTQETELPREITVGFTDSGADYRRAAARSRRLVGAAAASSNTDLAIVTEPELAERRADIWLQDLWAGRESAGYAVPLSRLALTPGDVITLDAGGRTRLLELQSLVDTESRAVTAHSIDPDVFDVPLATPQRRVPPVPAALGPVHALTLDVPTIDNDNPDVLTRVALCADPWPGPVAIWRSADEATYQRVAIAEAPSIIGVTLDALQAGPTGCFDINNGTRVQLYTGALASVSDAGLLNGGNACAVQTIDGAWEILQFANAELVGEKTYALSRLLRGQAGTEGAMVPALAAGAPFVLLDAHLATIANGLDWLERPLQLRLVAANRDYGDPSAVALNVTPQATGMRPLAPVHIRAMRADDGVHITWIRRTRVNGDTWAAGDVPLGETSEAYAVDILSGATVLRTLTSAAPEVIYASADEIADFGGAQTSLSLSVAQVSAEVGRGFPAVVLVSIQT